MIHVVHQLSPAANQLEELYAVPTGKRATARVVVVNRDSAPTSFRLALAPNGAADAPAQYVAYDEDLPAETSLAGVPLALTAGDVVRARAAGANVSFTLTAIES